MWFYGCNSSSSPWLQEFIFSGGGFWYWPSVSDYHLKPDIPSQLVCSQPQPFRILTFISGFLEIACSWKPSKHRCWIYYRNFLSEGVTLSFWPDFLRLCDALQFTIHALHICHMTALHSWTGKRKILPHSCDLELNPSVLFKVISRAYMYSKSASTAW